MPSSPARYVYLFIAGRSEGSSSRHGKWRDLSVNERGKHSLCRAELTSRDIHASRPLDRIPHYTPDQSSPASVITDNHDAPIINGLDEPYKPMRTQTETDVAPRAALGLLNLPNANRSTSSLFDAVLGGDAENRQTFSVPSFGLNTTTPSASSAATAPAQASAPVRTPLQPPITSRPNPTGVSPLNAGRPVRRRSVRDPRRPGMSVRADATGVAEGSRRGSNSNTETTDSWDQMSDADSARIHEGDEGEGQGGERDEDDREKVHQLERVVNKRYVPYRSSLCSMRSAWPWQEDICPVERKE